MRIPHGDGGTRVDLLAKVEDAARELWYANGIGIAFVDSAFAKGMSEDALVKVRVEGDPSGRVGVYMVVLTDVETS
jgi:hypothetical protein